MPKSVENKNKTSKPKAINKFNKTDNTKKSNVSPKKRINYSADKRIIKNFQTEGQGKNRKKRFNEEEFQKQLESFNLWEKKKKEKIEKLKKEKIQKELSTVNNDKNIHYNKKMTNKKLPSVLERLYTKDIQKRRQNKQILTKIYTPTFTPFLYSKGDKIKKLPKKKDKKDKKDNIKHKTQRSQFNFRNNYNYNTIDNAYEDDDDNENDNDDDNDYANKTVKHKKVKLIKIKKANSKPKHKKKHKVKFEDSSDYSDDNEKEDKEEIKHNRAEVENALRSRLFKRNKSVGIRKNKSVDNRY